MPAARAGLLLAVAAVAAAGEMRSPVELVLARGELTEDAELEWIRVPSAEARVTLYTKGRKPAQALADVVHEVPLPNVGMEPHSYLSHIVKNYDSLAEKTVFMPASKPNAGFSGFQRGAASLMPGVNVTDYIRVDATPLFVPTMAVTADLQQTSVRMGFMENAAERDVPKGLNFTACSAAGAAGWSPNMPNRFGKSVLEPLVKAQAAEGTTPSFEGFWAKHMSDVPMPRTVSFAHNGVMSVARDQILAHPKSFYEGLLEEVSGDKNPYQAFFLEYMWWYMFNAKGSSLCPADHPEPGAPPSRKNARQLQYSNSITVLDPKPGALIKFGDVVPVSWAVGGNYGPMQIELWRFGTFQTKLATRVPGITWNWPVAPHATSTKSSGGNTFGMNSGATTGLNTGYLPRDATNNPITGATVYRSNYILTPNDKYTIRVCPISEVHANTDLMCDSDPYAESGEFDIIASLDVQLPAAGYSHVNDCVDRAPPFCNATATPPPLVVAWSTYYTDDATMSLTLINAATGYTHFTTSVDNTGQHEIYLPPDTPSGQYVVSITATCFQCSNRFMGKGSTPSTVVGKSGVFNVVQGSSPPPSPSTPPAASPAPHAPFEVPILKAFRSTFGTDGYDIHSGVNNDYSTMSTYSGGNNCEYVCRVYRTVGNGRRLLFGGLQYSGGVGNPSVVGCTPAQIACNCCTRGAGR